MAGSSLLGTTDLSELSDEALRDLLYTEHDTTMQSEPITLKSGSVFMLERRMTVVDGKLRSTKWIAEHFKRPMSTINKRIHRNQKFDVCGEDARLISLELRRREASVVREAKTDFRIQEDIRLRQRFLSLPSHKKQWNYSGLTIDRRPSETA